ncbi:MAG: hypothetical protein EBS56_08995 [Planctomycetia bacterium]|nr:hypothetical protein [Planctomycetia bacterium]
MPPALPIIARSLLRLAILAPVLGGCRPAGESVARGSPTTGTAPGRVSGQIHGELRIVDSLYPLAAYCRLLGRPAPPLDISHWLPAGDGGCTPFGAFAPGRVYVVAFWASWCPRCREALPLLAAAPRRFPAGAVTVVAVSHEEPGDVTKFLTTTKATARDAADAATDCCLAADPDESVHRDYLEAVDETGIPTVFIVGPQGLIEWIGHPVDMEAPLADVVAGRWDRESFVARRRKVETVRARMAAIVERAGGADAARALKDLRDFAAERRDDAADLNEIGWLVVEFAEGKPLPAELVMQAVSAVIRSLAIAPDDANTLDTLAHLQAMQGRLDEAIATQTRAVELGGGPTGRFADFLHELESRRATP